MIFATRSRAGGGRVECVEPLGEIFGFSLVLGEQSGPAQLRRWGGASAAGLGKGGGRTGLQDQKPAV